MCTPITSSETNQNPSQESYWGAEQILITPGILQRVISFLSSHQDRMNMARTCKFWKAEIDRAPIQKITELGGIPVLCSQINTMEWKLLLFFLAMKTTDLKWSFSPPKASQIRWRDLRKLHSVAKNALDIITKQKSEENPTTSQPQPKYTIRLVIIDFPGNLNLLEDKLLFPSSKQNSEVNTPSYLKNKFPHRSIVCLNTVLLGYKGSEQRSQIQEIANKANENELTFRLADPMETIVPYLFHQIIDPVRKGFDLGEKIKKEHNSLYKEIFSLIKSLNQLNKNYIEIQRQKFQLQSQQCEGSLPETKYTDHLEELTTLQETKKTELYQLIPDENLKNSFAKSPWIPFLIRQGEQLKDFKLHTMKDNRYFHLDFRRNESHEATSFQHSIYSFQITFPSHSVPDFEPQDIDDRYTLIAADFPYTFGLPPVQKKEARERGKKRKLED